MNKDYANCSWCGKEHHVDHDNHNVRYDLEWFYFCGLECRAKWSWKNGLPMP